jgi:hypothetical protein
MGSNAIFRWRVLILVSKGLSSRGRKPTRYPVHCQALKTIAKDMPCRLGGFRRHLAGDVRAGVCQKHPPDMPQRGRPHVGAHWVARYFPRPDLALVPVDHAAKAIEVEDIGACVAELER